MRTWFSNGEYLDFGFTIRRHVHAETIEQIGKEADRWEEQFYLEADPEAEVNYGTSPDDAERAWIRVSEASKQHGMRNLARAAGISHTHVSRLIRGVCTRTPKALTRLAQAMAILEHAS